MSFADARSGAASTSSAAHDDDAFTLVARGVTSSVFQLTTNVTSFKRLVDALGTAKDTRDLRARLHRQRDALGQIAKDTTAAVKQLSELALQPGAPGNAKAAQTKLVKDFQAVLKDFQKAQRACAERESAFLPAPEPGRPLLPRGGALDRREPEGSSSYQRSGSLEQQALLAEDAQTMAQLDGEVEYNAALIEEREAGILEIQSQIGEVNEIFQDLAVLVNEQGAAVDDIEANILRTSARTRDARAELIKAETSQRAARGRMMWGASRVLRASVLDPPARV